MFISPLAAFKTKVKKMKDCIELKNVRVNNLKNISLDIPHNKFIVVTGVSGSGKSSLAFDTLYAEGQRRYVESLSAYARQFLGRMNKPDFDYIKGLPPAIAVEQKVNTRNPRSTVGTSTEIYDYLRMLYARIGRTYSPVSGIEVKRHTGEDVLKCVLSYSKGTKFVILSRLHINEGYSFEKQLKTYLQQGYSRIYHNGEFVQIEDVIENKIANEVILSPNPTKGLVKIKTSQKIENVEIISMQGQIIRQFKPSDEYLNLADLQS